MIYIHSLHGYGCSIKRGSDMVEKFLPDFDDCVLEPPLEEAIAEARREALRLLERFHEDGSGIPDAYMLEEVFYGDAGYDFFISTLPKDVWRFVLNSELFVETIGQIASMGICKISFYDQRDSRWQNHFKGLRKLRMYQMVRDHINEQPDLTKSQQIAFTSIVQKMTDLQ